MKRIIPAVIILLTFILTACLKPDPIDTNTAANVNLVDVIETGGYARDVSGHGNKIFVAASAAGTQIWEDANGSVTQVFSHQFGSASATALRVEPEYKLILSVSKDQGYLRQLNSELSGFDSVYVNHPNVLIWESEHFGDQNTQDMASTRINDSLLVLYNTDTDLGDGLRYTFLNRFTEGLEGYYYWEANTIKKYTGSKNYGIDAKGSLVASSHGELGVGLYRIEHDHADTLGVMDTRGEALEVKLFEDYLMVADNWAGMQVFSIVAGDSSLSHLAEIEMGGWVKHISMWNDMAVLSCGENGIFLVDMSDPGVPRVDQAIDAGYTYSTFVAEDMILAATREGVKRYHIESR
ncbi:MAG: hypothetical protein H8E26_01250 [FCB group bacterium]|nr:hypothetical protein [FCB group bacterium]MBL7122937.1 hypothetical protein [Candidatus Neomarinimicrobiota bacterium]